MKHWLVHIFYPLYTSVFIWNPLHSESNIYCNCLVDVFVLYLCKVFAVCQSVIPSWDDKKKWSGVFVLIRFYISFPGNYPCLYHTHKTCIIRQLSWLLHLKFSHHTQESQKIMGICKVHIKQTHMTTVSAQLSFNKRSYEHCELKGE